MGKRITYGIISLYYLLSGIEYAVILPTLNLYLRSFDAPSYYIGIVMSAFSLTGFLSAPIYGRVTDITGSTKATVIFSNLFEIGGNFMYFSATSPIFIVGSRLIAGIGSGSGSSIFGMISRSTSQEERTRTFSFLMSLRQFGLLFGPAFNLFLNKLDFYIGPFQVNAYTSPGIFMSLLWCIHTLLMVVGYKELSQYVNSSNEDDVFDENVQSSSDEVEINMVESRERMPSKFVAYVVNDLLREEVVVCLTVTFTVMFSQTGIETLLTPLTLQLFNWGEIPNSLFFSAAGLVIIVSFVSLGFLSKKYSDQQMLLVGCIVMTSYYAFFLVYIIFVPKEPIDSKWPLVLFLLGSFVLIFDLPFVWVPQASLFSKITSEKTQAFNQGIRLFVMGMGQIVGPLWAASLLDNLTIMAAVNFTIIALMLLMVISSYKRLKVNPENPTQITVNQTSERTPLLSSGNSIIT